MSTFLPLNRFSNYVTYAVIVSDVPHTKVVLEPLA